MLFALLIIFKIVELVITIVCVAIHDQSYNQEKGISMLVTGTFVGYSVVFAGLIAAYAFGNPLDRKVDMFYSITGAVLFLACGVVLICRYSNIFNPWGVISEYRDINLAKGSLAIIITMILIADAVLTYYLNDEWVTIEVA